MRQPAPWNVSLALVVLEVGCHQICQMWTQQNPNVPGATAEHIDVLTEQRRTQELGQSTVILQAA